jgi:hypothetical protein
VNDQVLDVRHTVVRSLARTAPASTGVAPGQRLGSLIGGIFGLIYVGANAGSLPDPWAAVLQIAAGVAFAGLAALLALARGPHSAGPAAGGGFRGSYWLVVAGEAAAILAGAVLLHGPAGLPRAVVARVSVVVGVHFLVLAAIWRLPLFRLLGGGIALCGAAGLAAAAGGAATAVVAGTGGVLPGFLLLTASYWAATRAAISDTSTTKGHAGPACMG